jgi:hypothetical protein
VERKGRVTHVLSHRRLTVDVHVGVLKEEPREVNLPEAYEALDLFDLSKGPPEYKEIGLAALSKKILAARTLT